MLDQLHSAAQELQQTLQQYNQQVVFAESCTGGLVSASLAALPGISEHLCGSAVVYQVETKVAWLGLSAAMIERAGVASQSVAEEMALGVLTDTPQASVAASITGHLGPNAPAEFDGVIEIGIAMPTEELGEFAIESKHFQLTSTQRVERQQEAALLTLQSLNDLLQEKLQPKV